LIDNPFASSPTHCHPSLMDDHPNALLSLYLPVLASLDSVLADLFLTKLKFAFLDL